MGKTMPGLVRKPFMKELTSAVIILSMSAELAFGDSTNLGIFSTQADIGNVAGPGAVKSKLHAARG